MLKFTWVKLLGPFEISGSFDSELISLRIPSLWSGTPLQHAEYSPSHQTATTEKKEIYIYIYIYISREREREIPVHIYIYIYMYVYVYIYIYTYVCVYIYIYMYMCVHLSLSIYIYTYTHVYIYIYIYIEREREGERCTHVIGELWRGAEAACWTARSRPCRRPEIVICMYIYIYMCLGPPYLGAPSL